MKLFFRFFISIVVILCLVSACLLIHKINLEKFTVVPTDEVEDVKRPFTNVYDQKGRKFNIILVSKPFQDEKSNQFVKDNKSKYIFIGITSYLEFPNLSSNPLDNFPNYDKNKYLDMCEAWLYGVRDPENYFRPETPKALISESDFANCHINAPNPDVQKKYDFIYICLKVKDKGDKCDDWATYNKNWTLAKKCLKVMCEDFGLRGLLVGRKDCELPGKCNTLMDTTDFLHHSVLKESYQQSKFIFLPNIADASPRVLTEALCTNLPCLVNKNILGGWKYVNDKTGEFFNDEHDIGVSIQKLMKKIENNEYTPRKYFIENYTAIHAGKRLKDFLYNTFGDRLNIPKEEVEYVNPAFKSIDFKPCTMDEIAVNNKKEEEETSKK